MNTPHRMGAALTYARRYGLFTLVGIAGEDDLDAPDLNAGSIGAAGTERTIASNGQNESVPSPRPPSGNGGAPIGNGPVPVSASVSAPGPARRSALSTLKERPPVLPPQDSARLRDAMLADIAALSPRGAVAWAGQMLASKNRLTAEDARAVEQAFEARFASLHAGLIDVGPDEPPMVPASAEPGTATAENHSGATSAETPTTAKDANPRRPLNKTVRHRNKEHLTFLRTQPCLVCGRQPSEPHHLRFAQPQALGRKVSDEFTVPLCRTHHRELHRAAKETQWWLTRRIAPLQVAEGLWLQSTSKPPDGVP